MVGMGLATSTLAPAAAVIMNRGMIEQIPADWVCWPWLNKLEMQYQNILQCSGRARDLYANGVGSIPHTRCKLKHQSVDRQWLVWTSLKTLQVYNLGQSKRLSVFFDPCMSPRPEWSQISGGHLAFSAYGWRNGPSWVTVHVLPLQEGSLPSQLQEEEYTFLSFIPTNKQKNKQSIVHTDVHT